MIKNRFGRIEDKFFRLIPKALAFRPIDDIKDFVYSYVLDEKEVNIDVLRENVRTYQDLQRTLENVKIRIDRLEKINTMHGQAVDGLQKDKQYEYYLARVESDLIGEDINRMQSEIQSDTFRLEEQNRQIDLVRTEQTEKQQIRNFWQRMNKRKSCVYWKPKRRDYWRNEACSRKAWMRRGGS